MKLTWPQKNSQRQGRILERGGEFFWLANIYYPQNIFPWIYLKNRTDKDHAAGRMDLKRVEGRKEEAKDWPTEWENENTYAQCTSWYICHGFRHIDTTKEHLIAWCRHAKHNLGCRLSHRPKCFVSLHGPVIVKDMPVGVNLQRRNSAPEMSEPLPFLDDDGSMELWYSRQEHKATNTLYRPGF